MNSEWLGSNVDEICRIVGWEGRFHPTGDWATVEQALGLPLPSDYKELLTRLPSGVFRNTIRMLNPIQSGERFASWRSNLNEVLEVIADEDLEYLEDVPYVTFPQKGGLLPWGDDIQGGMFCWITKSADPDKWAIAYFNQGLNEWWEHSGPVTQAILEVLTSGDDRDHIIRRSLINNPVNFEPSWT